MLHSSVADQLSMCFQTPLRNLLAPRVEFGTFPKKDSIDHGEFSEGQNGEVCTDARQNL